MDLAMNDELQASALTAAGDEADMPFEEGIALPTIEERLQVMEDRLARGSARMRRIETSVDENTAMTRANAEMTREVLELMQAAKAGFRVAGWVGTALRGAGKLAAAIAGIWALWQAIRHGTPPAPPTH
jgi:hypothetical protein